LPYLSQRSFTAERKTQIAVKRFFLNEIGLELSEYAVAAALITVAILVAFVTLGSVITDSINALANQIGP
jgi:Flp pilus assembly pilin Flp